MWGYGRGLVLGLHRPPCPPERLLIRLSRFPWRWCRGWVPLSCWLWPPGVRVNRHRWGLGAEGTRRGRRCAVSHHVGVDAAGGARGFFVVFLSCMCVTVSCKKAAAEASPPRIGVSLSSGAASAPGLTPFRSSEVRLGSCLASLSLRLWLPRPSQCPQMLPSLRPVLPRLVHRVCPPGPPTTAPLLPSGLCHSRAVASAQSKGIA